MKLYTVGESHFMFIDQCTLTFNDQCNTTFIIGSAISNAQMFKLED